MSFLSRKHHHTSNHENQEPGIHHRLLSSSHSPNPQMKPAPIILSRKSLSNLSFLLYLCHQDLSSGSWHTFPRLVLYPDGFLYIQFFLLGTQSLYFYQSDLSRMLIYSCHSLAYNHSVVPIVFRIMSQFFSTAPKRSSFTVEFKPTSMGLSPMNFQHIISAPVTQDFVAMHFMPQWVTPCSNVTSSRKVS